MEKTGSLRIEEENRKLLLTRKHEDKNRNITVSWI